jgi:hypothetical protein
VTKARERIESPIPEMACEAQGIPLPPYVCSVRTGQYEAGYRALNENFGPGSEL